MSMAAPSCGLALGQICGPVAIIPFALHNNPVRRSPCCPHVTGEGMEIPRWMWVLSGEVRI